VTLQPRPVPLLVAVVVVLVEAGALLVYAVVTIVQAVRGDRSSVLGVVLLAALLGLWDGALVVAARGLWRGRRWARSPIVVSELLLLAVGLQLAQGATRWAGVAIVVLTIAALGAALSPPVTASLGGPGRWD
jgi:hypothetical protein